MKRRGEKEIIDEELVELEEGCFSGHEISNGNRTDWSPIRSVIIQVITKSDDRAAGVRLFITSMITDRIGRHEVLLPINHKNYNFQEKKNTKV